MLFLLYYCIIKFWFFVLFYFIERGIVRMFLKCKCDFFDGFDFNKLDLEDENFDLIEDVLVL